MLQIQLIVLHCQAILNRWWRNLMTIRNWLHLKKIPQLPLYALYSLSGQGWKSGLTLPTWECTFFFQRCPVRHKTSSTNCFDIGTRVTCPKWMRPFWMGQLLLTCWSHKTAKWLSSMSTGLSNSETFLRDGHNKEELFRYLAEWIATLQLDGKMVVSISDDVESSGNHKHLIITRESKNVPLCVACCECW